MTRHGPPNEATLLDANRLEREEAVSRFHAGVKPHENWTTNAHLVCGVSRRRRPVSDRSRDYVDVRASLLDKDLKRSTGVLQTTTATGLTADGRPDRSEEEIRRWAIRTSAAEYFDDRVHFPDFASSTRSMAANIPGRPSVSRSIPPCSSGWSSAAGFPFYMRPHGRRADPLRIRVSLRSF